jgi:lipopolysaccharide/colanic/teichoic acid biosynthesis glycosyltransferase/glycosyltransferase involved in cell wall biosynthesis
MQTRIVYGVTSDISLNFYRGHKRALADAGFAAIFATSGDGDSEHFAAAEDVEVVRIAIAREISIAADIRSLWHLTRFLRQLCPTVTNFGTPKAGLLGNLAATITSVPCRIYILHGLRCETARGWKRRVLILSERVACGLAHRVICVSPSLRKRATDLGLTSPGKAVVLGSGTCNGVDIDRFLPTTENLQRTEKLRRELNLPGGVPVIGFVGRFTQDKGVAELLEAYYQVRTQHPELRLLLVGDFENGDALPDSLRWKIEEDAHIVKTGWLRDTSPFYHLMDLVVLPTHREGFPNVPLEAQAAGKPVVTTNATGAIDSVQNGTTGLIVPVGNATALAQAIGDLLADPIRREEMGRAGHEWVVREFAGDNVRAEFVKEYRRLVEEKLGARLFRRSRWSGAMKRGLDVICASIGIALLSPAMGVIALLIWITMGRPILYRQIRPGFRGKPFSLAKFRTMREAHDSDGRPLPDAERLTPFGAFLRKLSLDELPQLWNVLRGEMSLVGPRPLLMEYLSRYTPEQAHRHDVKPGITGWAQVNGRNAASWEQKFAYDLWYVDHQSVWLDLKIIALTIWKTLKREGISQPGHATMPEFTGWAAEGKTQ